MLHFNVITFTQYIENGRTSSVIKFLNEIPEGFSRKGLTLHSFFGILKEEKKNSITQKITEKHKMPYVNIKTNTEIGNKAESIKAGLGKAIECFPGKTEQWLMMSLEGNVKMYFQGKDSPCVFADVFLFGTPSRSACEAFAETVTAELGEILDVAPDRIYIKFGGTENWSWNGRLF